MHAPVLMLVTAFAASVAAAPLPITPIESPVEGLAVRDAEAALSQAQMDVLKRSIFERLEEIVPVKRDEINNKLPTHGLNDRDLEVRQGDLRQVEGDINAKRQDGSTVDSANSHGKREANKMASTGENDKRNDDGDYIPTNNAAANERRNEDGDYIPTNNAAANERRNEDGDYIPTNNSAANERRNEDGDYIPTNNSAANERRNEDGDYIPTNNSAANERRNEDGDYIPTNNSAANERRNEDGDYIPTNNSAANERR